MVLIASTFGATKKYADQDMMNWTLQAFLWSLIRQTDPCWKVFIACHDIPEDVSGWDHPNVIWCSAQEDPDFKTTRFYKRRPEHLLDPGEVGVADYGSGIDDMSRKSGWGMAEAGRWAGAQKISDFWILRMDSDDLLWKGMVGLLNGIIPNSPIEAVYNRSCHMYDPRRDELAEHRYPYSTTCNAMRIKRGGDYLPRWFYLWNDHTLFCRDVQRDKISSIEVDWTLCIITNSGNSLSGRPEISKEKNVVRIPITKEVEDRYGLGRV